MTFSQNTAGSVVLANLMRAVCRRSIKWGTPLSVRLGLYGIAIIKVSDGLFAFLCHIFYFLEKVSVQLFVQTHEHWCPDEEHWWRFQHQLNCLLSPSVNTVSKQSREKVRMRITCARAPLFNRYLISDCTVTPCAASMKVESFSGMGANGRVKPAVAGELAQATVLIIWNEWNETTFVQQLVSFSFY